MRTTKENNTVRLLEKPTDKPVTIGGALRAIRQERKIPLSEFARILGISQSHLSNIEHERKGTSPARAESFAKLLGYPGTQFS